MFELVEKIVKIPEVVDHNGEIVVPERNLKIKTREDVPCRSITDLKGYTDEWVFTEPSKTNTKDYVPIRKTIAAILARYSHEQLLQIGINDNINHPEEYDALAPDELYEGVSDYDDCDILDLHDAAFEMAQGERSAAAGREHSAASSDAASQGAQSEAASGGAAE